MINRRLTIAISIAVASVAIVGCQPTTKDANNNPAIAELQLQQARIALASGQFEQALVTAEKVVDSAAHRTAALLIAGEAATKSGDFERALAYYDRIPSDGSDGAIAAMAAKASLLIRVPNLAEAESLLLRLLDLQPNSLFAHRNLAFIYNAECRTWESYPHLFALLKGQQFTIEDLLYLGNPDSPADESELLKAARKAAPDNLTPAIGLATIALKRSEFKLARETIQEVISRQPESIAAHVVLGKILIDQPEASDLLAWHADLPKGADEHPEIWFLRGRWAEREGQSEPAIRCYWEAILRHPYHAQANYRLGQLLASANQDQVASLFAERASLQEELNNALGMMYLDGPILHRMQNSARLTEQLGRLWEAWAWHQSIIRKFPQEAGDSVPAISRLERILRENPPLTIPTANPAGTFGFSHYSLPQWFNNSRDRPEKSPIVEHDSTPSIVFNDVASSVGIPFQYHNGDEPELQGTPIYNALGGAMAAIDFDLDGWPDIFLTQGSDWPPNEQQDLYSDRLFRNDGSAFIDVTERARLVESGYGQGATFGDYDNDGFPDLYVANIGENALYHNCGDGTFERTFIAAPSKEWTSSCLLADLNGDSLPDIFDVNYLAGPEPFEMKCLGGRSCAPTHFRAAQDRCLLNNGDGSFLDVTIESGVALGSFKGLGVVAVDLHGHGLLSVFISSDTTENGLLVNTADERGGRLHMEDRALLSGVALDRDGRAQACMGIAIDDFQGDGLLDLFVTNFYEESNTLYRQESADYFVDDTRQTGLREPSYEMLGFGTQFLDADLDGWPDLVIANGHVDDFPDKNAPFQMRPQFFRNGGDGKFYELTEPALGEYFQRLFLGRSLARLDWNRDGLPDFGVIHLDQPFALVSNQTVVHGNYLTLQLRGTTCDRDAIGTTVFVELEGRRLTRQLTAGDGFLASNERTIQIGLGRADRINSLRVRWPSGREQAWNDVNANQQLLLVEGREGVYRLSPEH